MRPRDTFNTFYLYYQKASSHEIRQGDELLWEAFTHKDKQPFKHVVFWDA